MADLFSREQSKRLFGIITVGASAGAILGPLIASIVAQTVGANVLMPAAALIMLIPLPIIFYLQHLKRVELDNGKLAVDPSTLKIGGNPLEGFKQFFSSPFLIGIAVFILLYTAISSFAYFEQTNLLRAFDRDQRTQILANLALVVNVLTFALGFFATSRLTTRLGMPITLALVPAFMCAALLVAGIRPDPYGVAGTAGSQTGRELWHNPPRPGDALHLYIPGEPFSRPSRWWMWLSIVAAMRSGPRRLPCSPMG